MAAKKTAAPINLVYTGGSDGVVIHLPTHVVEFLHGVPTEVCAADAEALADHPDIHPAESSAATPDSKEDS